jgi:hypothetical protein
MDSAGSDRDGERESCGYQDVLERPHVRRSSFPSVSFDRTDFLMSLPCNTRAAAEWIYRLS